MIEVTKEILKSVYQSRPIEKAVRKYDYGLLLIIGGSDFYSGQPTISALAAFKAGVDVIRVIAPKRAADIIASFFPIACVFDGIVPITIQTHIVLSKLAPEVIAAKIEREYPSIVKRIAHEDGIPRKRRLSPLKAMYDEVFAANIKVVIADFPVAEKELVIQPLFWEAIDGTVDDFIKTFFMQPEQLKEMHEAGMIIGAHSYAHTSLKSLSYEEQKKDIAKSKDIIEGIIKSKISAFSYPFGYYDQNTLTIMRELGFRYGVLFNHQPLGPEPDNLLLSAYDYRDIRQHKKL